MNSELQLRLDRKGELYARLLPEEGTMPWQPVGVVVARDDRSNATSGAFSPAAFLCTSQFVGLYGRAVVATVEQDPA